MLTQEQYRDYIRILNEELSPAMGCTEPIALAYCAAVAAHHFKGELVGIDIEVSGNIIKNVKSVVVPNTDGMRGIQAATVAGYVANAPEKELRVIEDLNDQDRKHIKDILANVPIKVSQAQTGKIFDIFVTLRGVKHTVRVRIVDYHTNVAEILVDGEPQPLKEGDSQAAAPVALTDRSFMTVEGILEFAETVDVREVADVLDRQIKFNMEISAEGLKSPWGAQIGRTLMKMAKDEHDVELIARARAAAGSDARMSGCDMPVVINSGSGNQGITASVPVIVFAQELGSSKEQLYRALCISNLLAIHIKTGIGRLSAYCGVVSAGAGSAAAIAYLKGDGLEGISETLINTLGITSGIICDGAKSSCAAKIATSVEAGLLGYHMYKNGQRFQGGDGIVSDSVEDTIKNVCQLAYDGMAQTDQEILQIMLNN